ncbi:hypothetical protein KAF26_15255 [Xanthomonas translucens pv. secalis]|uniref:hypothetical protein n=1 Tax=Xanthomonas campestris pv. translucens TaxID=343 RepID=UPI001F27B223|nr:hypothetical protein [Xanthomonas translucens]UKE42779.1 hypothetical protein KAF26_15255 [Xanthomonas translucens pv. secalis]
MELKTLRDWVNDKTNIRGGAKANGLSATFRLAIMELMASRMTDRVSEEMMTGTLLGAFSLSSSICSEAFRQEGIAGCSWIKYAKSGTTNASETISGSDFALMIRLSSEQYRLSLFQAKRKKTKQAHLVNIHQVNEKSSSDSATPQFMRLWNYATETANSCVSEGSAASKLSWVHYLFYTPTDLICCSVDQLENVKDNYKSYDTRDSTSADGEENPKYGEINLSEKTLKSFLNLLEDGATVAHRPQGEEDKIGWLDIHSEQILLKVVDQLISFTDVYVADNYEGPSPELGVKHFFESNKALKREDIFKEIFDRDGNFLRPEFKADKNSVSPPANDEKSGSVRHEEIQTVPIDRNLNEVNVERPSELEDSNNAQSVISHKRGPGQRKRP